MKNEELKAYWADFLSKDTHDRHEVVLALEMGGDWET